MDIDTPIFKSGTEILLDLVKTVYADKFNAYYEGDPGDIPIACYPCVIVEKTQGEIRAQNTAQDLNIEVIAVRFVMNKMDDLGVEDDVDLTERKLRQLIEGRDITTGRYAKGTFIYELRKRLTLNGLSIDQTQSISYGVIDRSTLFSSEARVDVTLSNLVYREPDVN